MEQRYFSDMLAALANRASLGTVSWLGFANAPLRRHLMEVFSRPYGDTGNFLADPTFEAVFGWAPGPVKMEDLAGNLLTSTLVDAMDKPQTDVHGEYRFAKDRVPYTHQLAAWRALSEEPARSIVVASGTGSGKTECFMVPILDRLARDQAKLGGQLVGVRALFLYPLNALINSQRDRLRAWTSGFGKNIRFCLYNGVTPDAVPAGDAAQMVCEVLDRRTLRASPPPILVTNATMLEYMLVRTQDANILQASQGKLEWIVLDEAHTYVGSQAAELALLIRRVIHAFGVNPENVRFIATSATIGDPDGVGGEGLRRFLAQIAGVDISHVYVVTGLRQVPQLPAANQVRLESITDIGSLDGDAGPTPGRYRALVDHGIAREIRELFVDRMASPVARLSEVCSVIFGPAAAYSLDQQRQALEWLDMLTTAVDGDGTPFLPLRGHLFHQTLSGLWCCADPICSDKHGTKLDDPVWPFGKLFLAPRNHCSCGAPAYELVACEECGAIFLNGEERHGCVAQPIDVASIDEFELEADPDDFELTDEGDDSAAAPGSGHALLIANRPLPHTGELYVHRTSKRIVEATDVEAIRLIVHEDDGEGLTCPSCNAHNASGARLFRKARIGAPFLLGGMLPTLLEFAPDGEEPADHPYRGRRLLTFSDSRQGTARLAAKLQQDAERTKARGLIYHHALAKFLAKAGVGSEQIQIDIAKFEAILATPGMPEAAKTPIIEMLKERRIALAGTARPTPISFREIQTAIAQEGHEFRNILHAYQGYSRAVFGGAEGADNLAGMLLIRELGRRPRRQNNLETMGMVVVRYPGLDNINAVPPDWAGRGFSIADWRDFLKIALDYFVRGGGSLDVPDIWRNWLGIRYPRNWIVPSSQIETARGQRRWPSARRSKLQSTLVRLLAFATKADVETANGQDIVDSLLEAAWDDVKRVLATTGSGYMLKLEELAFSPMTQAWICPVSRRFLDTTLRGISPYLPKQATEATAMCEAVEIPVYDAPFGESTDGIARLRHARAWISAQHALTRLREEGLWSNLNDRVVELAPYFATAEHSAQQSSKLLGQYEKRFKEGHINLLSCSTTMELGIDIGGVQLVAMNNVPPHPANYLQRAGRAGRRQETRSTAVTLCKSNPHDLNVFGDTRWAFEAKLPPPVVSLNSAIIVQRHVNSMVLAQFLSDLLKSSVQDMSKLTCGWFFEKDDQGPAARYISWCQAYLARTHPRVEGGLGRLVRHSVFEGQGAERLIRQSGTEMSIVRDRWNSEWDALLEQESAFGPGGAADPAVKALAFQKRRLSDEYLLRELATQSFLPGYGFPAFIASFDNTTVSAARRLPIAGENARPASRDDNRFQRLDMASRDLVTALREYAPGSEIVMDGLVYRSAGITLNWHIPATQQDARETQAIKFAWRCRQCGASGTTHSLQLAATCDACGTAVRSSDIQQFLEPAGFSVDFYVDPHNDVTSQHFVPVERPWISALGDWSPLPNPRLGRFRPTTDGRVYHHSAGFHGTGYCLCLACGRAEPMNPDRTLPRIFEHEHKKLRSRHEDRTCPGSTNRWAIKEGIVLGHQLRTDVLEMQIKDVNGQWISDRTVALTLAVALRDSLASLIGVQATELGCDVQEMRAEGGERCQSIFIFDRFAAGYASGSEHLVNAMFRDALRRLDCPKGCDSSCPHCVLDFDQRFESSSLNRHAALAVLSAQWLDMLKLPNELCYFGDGSRIEFSGINEAVLKESGRQGAALTRLYAGGSASSADFAPSTLRLLSYRLAALSRAVQIIIESAYFDALSEADRFSLASLADHPNVTVQTVSKLPRAANVEIVAEVVTGNRSVAWACADNNIRSANANWGASEFPLVVGEMDPIRIESTELKPDGIRPSTRVEGDREIVLHRELDGELQGFGKRFWKAVSDEHKGAAPLLLKPGADVASIQYSDRYLFTPVSIALVLEIVSGLKGIVGPSRWDNPNVEVTTTQFRGGAESRAVNTVYADWRDASVRDAVVEASFRYLGIAAKLNVLDKFAVQHGRVLEIGFSSGQHLIVRLDQGVSYWRVMSPARSSKKFSIWFNFGPTGTAGLEPSRIEGQAKRVAEMAVVIEGGALPTEMFVKIRTTG